MPIRRLFIALPLAGLSFIAQAGPLSLNTALDLAERQSPNLAASSAQLDASRSAAVPAGALPDPKLITGIDNYPISGMDGSHLKRDFMTMQKVGLMQEVPNADKRRAREDVAAADIEIASAQREVSRLQVRRDTAIAWLNRYYLERKLDLFTQLERENRTLDDAVRAQITGGRSPVADAVMPKQEAVRLDDRQDDLSRDLAKARAALRRQIGGAGDDVLIGEPPEWPIDAEHFHQHLQHHPELQASSAEVQRATAEVREADAAKKSDWGVEVAYQKRAPEFGDMVSVQFTFDLPVFTSRRQEPQAAAKRAELDRAEAERDDMLREHVNQLDNDLADYAALDRQLDRAQNTTLPLARQKVDLLTTSYKAGRTDLSGVIAARRELIDERLRLIDLQRQRAITAAQLHFAYGDETQ